MPSGKWAHYQRRRARPCCLRAWCKRRICCIAITERPSSEAACCGLSSGSAATARSVSVQRHPCRVRSAPVIPTSSLRIRSRTARTAGMDRPVITATCSVVSDQSAAIACS